MPQRSRKARCPSRHGVISMRTSGLNVGVVGVGYWGSKHVRTMRSLDSVGHVVVIDPSEERVARLRHSYPEVDAYATLDAALEHVDAVVVATPPSTHAP